MGVSIYWTGLLDSPMRQKIVHTRFSLAPPPPPPPQGCVSLHTIVPASPSHFACNGLVPTSYANILASTVYLNTIKLAIEQICFGN